MIHDSKYTMKLVINVNLYRSRPQPGSPSDLRVSAQADLKAWTKDDIINNLNLQKKKLI